MEIAVALGAGGFRVVCVFRGLKIVAVATARSLRAGVLWPRSTTKVTKITKRRSPAPARAATYQGRWAIDWQGHLVILVVESDQS